MFATIIITLPLIVIISKNSPTFKLITSLNKDTLETQIVLFCTDHCLSYDYEAMITSKNNLARASFQHICQTDHLKKNECGNK